MSDVENFVMCRLLVLVVGGNREGAPLFDGVFGVGIYFLRAPLSVGGFREWVVGLGDLYGK